MWALGHGAAVAHVGSTAKYPSDDRPTHALVDVHMVLADGDAATLLSPPSAQFEAWSLRAWCRRSDSLNTYGQPRAGVENTAVTNPAASNSL